MQSAKVYQYNLFGKIPLLKTKLRYGVERYLLFGFLPILKNKYIDDDIEMYLFSFIPLMLRNKIRHIDYKPIDFGMYNFSGNLPFETYGLQIPEDWGCWSDGDKTSLFFRTDNECFAEFDINVFLAPGKERQCVAVYINDCIKQKYVFEQGKENTRIVIGLPKSKKLHIMFKYEDVKSPADLGLSDDSRKISVGFKTMEIKRM